jgi:hypothetical protein
LPKERGIGAQGHIGVDLASATQRVPDQHADAVVEPQIEQPVAIAHDASDPVPLRTHLAGQVGDVVRKFSCEVFASALEHANRIAGFGESARGDRAAIAGAHDDHVELFGARRPDFPLRCRAHKGLDSLRQPAHAGFLRGFPRQ